MKEDERKDTCMKRKFLGAHAQKVLLYALPFMIVLAFALAAYIASLAPNEIALKREWILLMFETMSRLFFCISVATVLADIAERKTKREA
jgi:hypothetical protein